MPDFTTFVAAGLVASGCVFALLEYRAAAADRAPNSPTRSYFAVRRRRRLRIAAALALLGGLMLVGRRFDPQLRPIAYAATWLIAALVAGTLLWWGLLDLFHARRFWADQTHRHLADIARARADLQALRAHEQNGRNGP